MVDLRLRARTGFDTSLEANATCRVWSKPRYQVDQRSTANESADIVKLDDFRKEAPTSTAMAA